jgi:hypothetical protein
MGVGSVWRERRQFEWVVEEEKDEKTPLYHQRLLLTVRMQRHMGHMHRLA